MARYDYNVLLINVDSNGVMDVTGETIYEAAKNRVNVQFFMEPGEIEEGDFDFTCGYYTLAGLGKSDSIFYFTFNGGDISSPIAFGCSDLKDFPAMG